MVTRRTLAAARVAERQPVGVRSRLGIAADRGGLTNRAAVRPREHEGVSVARRLVLQRFGNGRMRARPVLGAAAMIAALVGGCGGSDHAAHGSQLVAAETPTVPARAAGAPRPRPPQALVTDESQNRLLIVDLPSGHVARRLPLPPDPEDIAADGDGGLVL